MRTLNYFLIAIFALLTSCDTSKSHTPDVYNFLLSQPDGTVPDCGYAIICEKQIDPSTGFTTISIPVSDTIYWEGRDFSWIDNRKDNLRPLEIKIFSPDEHTPIAERLITEDLFNANCELFFPQSRSIEVIIRNDENHHPAHAWAIITTPSEESINSIDGASSVSTSHFHDFSLSESNRISLKSEALFSDSNPMYCHLFRFDGNIWHETKAFEADLYSAQGELVFNLEYTLSCYE